MELIDDLLGKGYWDDLRNITILSIILVPFVGLSLLSIIPSLLSLAVPILSAGGITLAILLWILGKLNSISRL